MATITQTCTTCGKQFLIIDKEQTFLSEKGLPFPTQCPNCRHQRRLKLRGSERVLYKAKCAVCGRDIVTSYDPTTVTQQILCIKDYEAYFNQNDPIISDPLPQI